MFQVPGVVKFNANWGLRTEDCELETEDYTMLSRTEESRGGEE
jgi:hypothetical protein